MDTTAEILYLANLDGISRGTINETGIMADSISDSGFKRRLAVVVAVPEPSQIICLGIVTILVLGCRTLLQRFAI